MTLAHHGAPVRAHGAGAREWLWRPAPVSAPRLRLLCLGYAGARAQLFGGWPARLPAGIEVAAVQLPGRGERARERPLREWRPLVEALAGALEGEPDVPYAVFGHSLGALLGYELARELRRRGAPEPRGLAVASSPAPHLERREGSLAAAADEALRRQLEPLGSGSSLTEEARRLLLPYLRADLEVYDTYAHEPGEPLSCPIAALAGRRDPFADERELAAWAELTSGEVSVRVLPGDHFFIHPAEGVLVASVRHRLAEWASDERG